MSVQGAGSFVVKANSGLHNVNPQQGSLCCRGDVKPSFFLGKQIAGQALLSLCSALPQGDELLGNLHMKAGGAVGAS
jgi:hypothetical protein